VSLRDRLTLFNIALLGGLFIFFGVVAYVMVTVLSYDQIDSSLQRTAEQLIRQTRIDTSGEMGGIITPNLKLTSNIIVQIWARNKLVDYSPSSAR